MDDWDELRAQLREEIRSRFPKESLLDVDLIWRGSNDPESQAAEPNTSDVRLIPRGPEEYNAYALESPSRGKIPEHVYGPLVNEFWKTQKPTIEQLAKDLKGRLPERVRFCAAYGGYTVGWVIVEPPLTQVMARLDRTDLETLDALIAAGCAPNRADAIRWALARVRERPAYRKLVDRVREIQALRAEL